MTQRFYVDEDGNYLGSYDDAEGDIPEEFEGAIEVPAKPRPPTVPRFFVDANGKYLGSFDGLDEEIPADMASGIEVPTAPIDARQPWKGGEWLPYSPEVVLSPVTRRQLRLTLVREGIALASVEALIEAMPEGLVKEEAKIEWADAQSFNRDHPTLLLIAEALSLSPTRVDEMWVKAMVA
ncbi:MAG: hypothetical protein PGN22_15530 [Agrobacterium cavarae]